MAELRSGGHTDSAGSNVFFQITNGHFRGSYPIRRVRNKEAGSDSHLDCDEFIVDAAPFWDNLEHGT